VYLCCVLLKSAPLGLVGYACNLRGPLLARDNPALIQQYPGRLHNDVLNKVSFVLPIELAERVVKQALSRLNDQIVVADVIVWRTT